jgi:peptidyl-prolyl cis-trans isomerase A (cyclophilin A)
MHARLPLIFVSLMLTLAACGSETSAGSNEAPVEKGDVAEPAAKPPVEAPAKAEPAMAAADTAAASSGAEGAASALMDPSKATAEAPATFKVKFETTKGSFVVEANREWSPNGVDRFYNMVQIGYFKDIAFFRAIEGFMVQFGIHGDPRVNATWRTAQIPDDPVKKSNTRGMVTFAKTGAPDSRTVQIFINYSDRNTRLDTMGFSPFGKVIEGMDVVDSLYTGYGEGAPRGKGPSQGQAQAQGNVYLKAQFPQLDYIQQATIIQ